MTEMRTKTCLPFLLFLLILCVPAVAKAQSTTVNLTVTTDKQAYYGFSPVNLSGALQCNGAAVSDGLVGLQIQDSQGNVVVIRTLMTGASTPSSLPCQISSAYLSDMSGNSQSSIEAGNLAYFTINLINNGKVAQSMLVTINLYDSDGIPIGEISEQCSLLADTNGAAILSIQIPAWARTGTANGYADIYSNWPSNGGVPISLEQPFQFAITNGLNSIGNISSSNGNQGTYSLTFRLPTMGPVDANYTVYASTSYSGTTVTKSTSFNSQFGDFNGDGVVDSTDFFIFANAFISAAEGNTNYCQLCDMTQSGTVNSQDFFIFLNCFITYWSASQN